MMFCWFLVALRQYGLVGHWLTPGKATVGALDFGGASTQITFATREKMEDKHDLMKLRLYGHDYSLYTHSFLCYGRDQALKKLLAHVVQVQRRAGCSNLLLIGFLHMLFGKVFVDIEFIFSM